jgi:hypothetical protein
MTDRQANLIATLILIGAFSLWSVFVTVLAIALAGMLR